LAGNPALIALGDAGFVERLFQILERLALLNLILSLLQKRVKRGKRRWEVDRLEHEQAGCDRIMPRSAFSQRLPELMSAKAF
jgi:hypothetical protein